MQLLLADTDSYRVVINYYNYRQNEREYIDRQKYKNPSCRRWLDYSNLDKIDYRYDTAHAKEANYYQEEVPSPYYIQEGAALAPSILQFEDYRNKTNLENKNYNTISASNDEFGWTAYAC